MRRTCRSFLQRGSIMLQQHCPHASLYTRIGSDRQGKSPKHNHCPNDKLKRGNSSVSATCKQPKMTRTHLRTVHIDKPLHVPCTKTAEFCKALLPSWEQCSSHPPCARCSTFSPEHSTPRGGRSVAKDLRPQQHTAVRANRRILRLNLAATFMHADPQRLSQCRKG